MPQQIGLDPTIAQILLQSMQNAATAKHREAQITALLAQARQAGAAADTTQFGLDTARGDLAAGRSFIDELVARKTAGLALAPDAGGSPVATGVDPLVLNAARAGYSDPSLGSFEDQQRGFDAQLQGLAAKGILSPGAAGGAVGLFPNGEGREGVTPEDYGRAAKVGLGTALSAKDLADQELSQATLDQNSAHMFFNAFKTIGTEMAVDPATLNKAFADANGDLPTAINLLAERNGVKDSTVVAKMRLDAATALLGADTQTRVAEAQLTLGALSAQVGRDDRRLADLAKLMGEANNYADTLQKALASAGEISPELIKPLSEALMYIIQQIGNTIGQISGGTATPRFTLGNGGGLFGFGRDGIADVNADTSIDLNDPAFLRKAVGAAAGGPDFELNGPSPLGLEQAIVGRGSAPAPSSSTTFSASLPLPANISSEARAILQRDGIFGVGESAPAPRGTVPQPPLDPEGPDGPPGVPAPSADARPAEALQRRLLALQQQGLDDPRIAPLLRAIPAIFGSVMYREPSGGHPRAPRNLNSDAAAVTDAPTVGAAQAELLQFLSRLPDTEFLNALEMLWRQIGQANNPAQPYDLGSRVTVGPLRGTILPPGRP